MSEPFRVQRDAPLRERNTFRIAAHASRLIEVSDAGALADALANESRSPMVLGGGSNLLFAGDPEGALLALTGRRVEVVSDDGANAIVRADAGVEWHALVMDMLSRGLHGLENLALIPGTVGAAPIQNIGAYGVEVRERIHAVETYEPSSGRHRRFAPGECGFAYRDSLFKREPDRYVVTVVEFALTRDDTTRVEYAGIGDELAAMGVADAATPAQVAEAVIRLRRRKLPDPAVIGNAGSFFKNPIVPREQAEALQAEHPALPAFRGDSDATRKLSAAWLIDACGWKGHRDGDAGVSDKHALVLVNHGAATGMQLLNLARRIAESVRERFGVDLEPEPRIVGAKW